MNEQDLKDYAAFVVRDVDTVARKLEDLAARLRRRATGFERLTPGPSVRFRTAVALSGDVVSEYTNGVGNLGTFLENLIYDAGILDQKRSEFRASMEEGK